MAEAAPDIEDDAAARGMMIELHGEPPKASFQVERVDPGREFSGDGVIVSDVFFPHWSNLLGLRFAALLYAVSFMSPFLWGAWVSGHALAADYCQVGRLREGGCNVCVFGKPNPTTTSALDMLIFLPYVASKDADYP